jgi:hypothetical protein
VGPNSGKVLCLGALSYTEKVGASNHANIVNFMYILVNLDPGFHSQLWIIAQCDSSNHYELKEMKTKKKNLKNHKTSKPRD